MASLIVRRRRPLLAAVVIGSTSLLAAFAAPDVYTASAATFLATMVVLYSVGRYGDGIGGAIAVIVAMGVGTIITDSLEAPEQILWLAMLGGGPLAIGRVMASRTRLQAQLRESTRELERDRVRRANSAVEDERARLATELQAVIANAVTTIVVQAEAVPRVIAAGNAPLAGRALAEVEHTGRDALAETRRLLGILRRDGEGAALAPQPTLAEVALLVDQVRGAGIEVELSLEGERGAIAAGPDLAAYRVLQQALEAAASVGARSAAVVVHYGPDELRLEVRDDRREATIDPERLLAMRERLGLYGGRVQAGVDEQGAGFRLVARLPLAAVAA